MNTMENSKKEELLLPPPPHDDFAKWGNSSVEFQSSQGSLASSLGSSGSDQVRERAWSESISFDSILTNITPPIFQRKKGTIEESRQEFHDRNQRFLRQAAR